MALSILDGNQSATTLSTILSSGQHITAHTVVSLGTQAITDIVNATSAGLTNTQLRASAVTVGGTVTVGNSVTISSLPAISGTVTANAGDGFPAVIYSGILQYIDSEGAIPVTIGSALPAGTNRIGVVTIGAGTVTIGAGTAQIGSVTIGNSVTIGSLPSISGTVTAMAGGDFGASIENVNDVGNVTKKIAVQLYDESGSAVGISINPFPISGTVTANTFAVQGTAVTTSNFTSTTASTVLANYNATREVLAIFNEGAGNLHICAGATCTTIAYQVRLSAGDYYEVPNHQTTITHSAVFATSGTARVTEVS
jgi:hypothetical protein